MFCEVFEVFEVCESGGWLGRDAWDRGGGGGCLEEEEGGGGVGVGMNGWMDWGLERCR